jgi:DNA-directed RNA polymerase specialized sigma24 family protein
MLSPSREHMNRDVSGTDFELFAAELRPRLVRAFVASRGVEGAADAAAEALAYAFEHWGRIREMENPAGYLYRVGQSRTRVRPVPSLPAPETIGVPEVEPALIPALLALPDTQRTAVWLVHACEWRYAEVAEAMGTSVSMVGNHVSRALEALRGALEVESHA